MALLWRQRYVRPLEREAAGPWPSPGAGTCSGPAAIAVAVKASASSTEQNGHVAISKTAGRRAQIHGRVGTRKTQEPLSQSWNMLQSDSFVGSLPRHASFGTWKTHELRRGAAV